jgi:hypothetical protein
MVNDWLWQAPASARLFVYASAPADAARAARAQQRPIYAAVIRRTSASVSVNSPRLDIRAPGSTTRPASRAARRHVRFRGQRGKLPATSVSPFEPNADTSPYPPFLWRDTISALKSKGDA